MATRFLDCVFDSDARTLTRGGLLVHLTPRAFEVLRLLLQERPRAVPKTEILERVWPGTFVTDASLARTIHEIRDAIGDGAAAGTIRTVHGHGYGFSAEAIDVTSAGGVAHDHGVVAWLLTGTQAFPLTDGELIIGRDPAVAIPLESRHASWHHARLVVTGAQVTIEDLGSKNGTEVSSQPLVASKVLLDGDDVVIGATRFVFRTGQRVDETV